MDARLTVLKLFLNELGVPADIRTINDRKRLQKAVYLGQIAGVDLGYQFGWYVRGPYSTGLTRDYFSLAEALASGARDFEGKELDQAARTSLQRIRPIVTPPAGVALSQEDWLELVASVHFLRQVRHRTTDDTRQVIRDQKPHLAAFLNNAENELSQIGLLGAN